MILMKYMYIWYIFVYTVHMFHIVYLCWAHFSHARIGVERKLSKIWVEKDKNTDAPPLQIFFFFPTNTDEPCTTNMFLLLWVDRYSAANIICLLQDAKCIYSNRPTLSRTHDIIKISKHHDTFQGFQQMYLTFIIKSCETKNCHVLSLALPECWNWVKYGHSPRRSTFEHTNYDGNLKVLKLNLVHPLWPT